MARHLRKRYDASSTVVLWRDACVCALAQRVGKRSGATPAEVL